MLTYAVLAGDVILFLMLVVVAKLLMSSEQVRWEVANLKEAIKMRTEQQPERQKEIVDLLSVIIEEVKDAKPKSELKTISDCSGDSYAELISIGEKIEEIRATAMQHSLDFQEISRMNSSPMIFRLDSGSVTPASRARKRSRASTMTRCMPRFCSKVARSSSDSFLRIRPWST